MNRRSVFRRWLSMFLAVTMMFGLSGSGSFSQTAYAQTQSIADLRTKWGKLLTGEGQLDPNNPLVAKYISDVDMTARTNWDKMTMRPEGTADTRDYIFSDLPMLRSEGRTGSSQITLTFDRLKAIVLAYKTPETSFYNDQDVFKEIVAAMDLMIENHYSLANSTAGTGTGLGSGTSAFGNWYDWRIGTPRQLNDLLLMISSELTEEQINRYVAPILSNNKKIDTTGANKTWIASVVAQAGILIGDESLLSDAKNGLKSVFTYVSSGDGFYVDGSFVQHSNYAYTGGYGKALLCTIAPLMYVLSDTPWEISYMDGCEQNFYDMVFEAYEPLIYGGRFMDMSREREISRIANQDSIPGRQAIRAIILLLDVLPEDQRVRAESMLKEWLSDDEVLAQVCSDPTEGYLEYYLAPGAMVKAIEIAESNIEPRGSLVLHKRFSSMDRVVHLREDFGYTISMSSRRIKNTEGTNDEGLRLWHITDGLTYLYNNDKTLYSDHYWATVDYQRLPGTTVNRIPARGPKVGYGTFNANDWVGGSDLDGVFGIAGMEMNGIGSSGRDGAHAKKSWFMFDDEIVAIGSDISSSLSGSDVETIVENRKVDTDFSNRLVVNGNEMTFELGGGESNYTTQALEATTVTSGKNTIAKYTLPVATNAGERVIFECDVKMPSLSNFFAIKLYGGDAQKEIAFITMREGALVPRISSTNGKDAYTSEAALTANQWHHIKVDMDMGTGTFNYYFDGKHLKNASGISGNTNTQAANLEDMAFFNDIGTNKYITAYEIATPNGGLGTMLVDNVRINSEGIEYQEDFELYSLDSSVDDILGWKVTQTDTESGAGITIKQDVTISREPAIQNDQFAGVNHDVEWIHLEGSEGKQSDVGYYFPGKSDINGLRERRTGSWDLVNTYEKFTDKLPRTNDFVTFWFDHGKTPDSGEYAYVLLPGKSAEETAEYNENPDIQILKQDDKIHSVKETTLDITGINFWEKGKFGAVSVDKPASVMLHYLEDGLLEIAISDPTQKASYINMDLYLPVQNVVEHDEEVSYEVVDGVARFTVNTSKAAGKSFKFIVEVDEYDNTFESFEEGDVPEHWSVLDGIHQVVKEDDNQVLEIASDSGKNAIAMTEVNMGAEGGIIKFQVKTETGAGCLELGEEGQGAICLEYADGKLSAPGTEAEEIAFESGIWHDVWLKLNTEEQTYIVAIDGYWWIDGASYQGNIEKLLLTAPQSKKIWADNLMVREAINTPPTTPKGLTYTSYGDAFVDLIWEASESENPVTYLVQINQEEVVEAKTNQLRVTGLEPDTSYMFEVQAVDCDENYSEFSSPVYVVTIPEWSIGKLYTFDDCELGLTAPTDWVFSGADPLGYAKIVVSPTEEQDVVISIATNSDAAIEGDSKENTGSFTQDRSIYVYSGTNASGKGYDAYTVFENQTEVQSYKMKVYFDQCIQYTNFALVGDTGSGSSAAALSIMLDSNGIGYRDGSSPSTTQPLLGKIEGEWIEFEFIADPAEQKFSVIVNGDEVLTDRPFRNSTVNINKLIFSAPGSAIGGIYVDDVILPIEKDSEEVLEEILDELDMIEVEYGTDFYDLPLPETVLVRASDEPDGVDIKVNWDKSTYDPKKSGVQTVIGELAYPVCYSSNIKPLKIKVQVEKPIYTVTIEDNIEGGYVLTDFDSAAEKTKVTLTAVPDDGYEFVKLIVDGQMVQVNKQLEYSFRLEKDVVVTAEFCEKEIEEKPIYHVRVAAGIEGGSVFSDVDSGVLNTKVTLTVVPDDGYEFVNIKVDGQIVQVNNQLEYKFNLKKDVIVTAEFSKKKPKPDRGSSSGGSSSSTGWIQNASGWRFREVNGSYTTNNWKYVSNKWYYFGADGYMATNWLFQGDKWYFLNQDGSMAEGWVFVDGKWYYLEQQQGYMLSGWNLIHGKWYYLSEQTGECLINTITPDGYHVDITGARIQS